MSFHAMIPRRHLSRQVRSLPPELALRQALRQLERARQPRDDAMQAAGPVLARIEAKQAGIAADVALLRVRADGKPGRDAALRALASTLGLGATWAAATAIAMILGNVRKPPPGAAAAAAALAGVALSVRQIHRILTAADEAAIGDKGRALCQFWPARDDGDSRTNKDSDHAT